MYSIYSEKSPIYCKKSPIYCKRALYNANRNLRCSILLDKISFSQEPRIYSIYFEKSHTYCEKSPTNCEQEPESSTLLDKTSLANVKEPDLFEKSPVNSEKSPVHSEKRPTYYEKEPESSTLLLKSYESCIF